MKLVAIAGAVAALITLGMTSASASTDSNFAKVIKDFQAASIKCLSTKCVIIGDDATGANGKTAFLDLSNGSVHLNSGTLKSYIYGPGNKPYRLP